MVNTFNDSLNTLDTLSCLGFRDGKSKAYYTT